MSNSKKDFFKKKHDWSRVKDSLLASYLSVYFAKLLHTGRPIVYVDCFAGAGRFEDGEDGSPLIALKERVKAIEHTAVRNAKIDMIFIEPEYYGELENNISAYLQDGSYGTTTVIHGSYEKSLPHLLNKLGNVNLFLYVDPFGIKYLGNDILRNVCHDFKGNVEVLLNLNSFGFVREGCRIHGAAYHELDEELDERDTTILNSADSSSVALMSAIAGGDYWIKLIDDYNKGLTDSTVIVEQEFSTEFKKLHAFPKGPYKFVLDIPIRIKKGSFPKYRMVHFCNHPDGCVAMADNMINRSEELYIDVQSHGQLELFPTAMDVNQHPVPSVEDLAKGLLEVIEKEDDRFRKYWNSNGFRVPNVFRDVKAILAGYFYVHGVVCSSRNLTEALAYLERTKRIQVNRQPAHTKSGEPTRFWTEKKGRSVQIRRMCE